MQQRAADVEMTHVFERQELVEHEPLRRSWAKTAVAAALATAAAVALVAVGTCARAIVPAGNHGLPEPSEMEQIIVKPPRDMCSKTTENCASTKCCQVTGYNCFYKKQGVAACMKSCTPGEDGICTMPHELVPLKDTIGTPGLSLFCFSVYTKDTGSTKPSHELELLQLQFKHGESIFSCAQWGLYGDVEATVAPGVKTVQVHDVAGDFHFAKRKNAGTWINTGLFVQVWKQIAAEGNWVKHDWVVKVDADAVFFPYRLLWKLAAQKVTAGGIYLENCKYVDYGYFGNLEVFSHEAFATLVANADGCKRDPAIPWKVGVEGGKYGPMGEDLFAQQCMDKHGVSKVEAFDVSMDGACPADRPEAEKENKKYIPSCKGTVTPAIHPFKKPEAYQKCLEESQR